MSKRPNKVRQDLFVIIFHNKFPFIQFKRAKLFPEVKNKLLREAMIETYKNMVRWGGFTDPLHHNTGIHTDFKPGKEPSIPGFILKGTKKKKSSENDQIDIDVLLKELEDEEDDTQK